MQAATATAVKAKTPRVVDHRYYYGVAAAFLLIVFAGFARTYYLKAWFGEPPLPLLLHIHGAVMTLWYALFAVQVTLAATRRVRLHRKLGVAGIFLAGLAAILGVIVSLGLARRRLLVNPASTGAPLLLGLQLFSIVLLFVIFISLAVYYRRRPDYHKRLMTLAMLSTLGPAITRLPLPFIANHDVGAAIAFSITFIILCVVVDSIWNRRLHPVFGWGGAALIGSVFVIAALAQTAPWVHFVRRDLQL